jgi:integrase
MARRVKDKALDSRDARRKLSPRDTCYWRTIERGLHLGYRRIKNAAGTWWARHYIGSQKYEVESLGNADDLSDPDGVAILSYWQAQEKARERMVQRAHAAAGKSGPYTVADAMEDYFRFAEGEGRGVHTIRDARYRDKALIRPKLGEAEVATLTADKLRKWRDDLVKAPPRVRTRKGEAQKYREVTDDNGKRARRSSANRTWSILRAALNHAFHNGKAVSDLAWRKVKPFKAVDAARIRYLSIAEAKRVINSCEPDFRPLVQAALQTGARYSELARLTVADFNPDVGTVQVRQSKSGKPRHIVLTDEGVALFKQLTAGRAGDELTLRRKDGSAWAFAYQIRPMVGAVERAKIKPAISFHILRHTWASHAVMNGMPLMVVGRNMGHADTRMVEKHYGHLAPSYVAEAVRAGAPKFGFKPDKKVATLA